MITIANCSSLQEALRLRMLLESVGITAFIPDEFTAGAAPHHFLTSSGVRLQVAEAQAAEARQVVGQG